jgi:hypothetical protein
MFFIIVEEPSLKFLGYVKAENEDKAYKKLELSEEERSTIFIKEVSKKEAKLHKKKIKKELHEILIDIDIYESYSFGFMDHDIHKLVKKRLKSLSKRKKTNEKLLKLF